MEVNQLLNAAEDPVLRPYLHGEESKIGVFKFSLGFNVALIHTRATIKGVESVMPPGPPINLTQTCKHNDRKVHFVSATIFFKD